MTLCMSCDKETAMPDFPAVLGAVERLLEVDLPDEPGGNAQQSKPYGNLRSLRERTEGIELGECRAEHPSVNGTARGRQIGSQTGSVAVDQLVFDAFVRLRRRTRGPIIALSDSLMITNLSAAELLLPSDRPRLWAQARSLLAASRRASGRFTLSCGLSGFASYRAIVADDVTVGALVQLANLSPGPRRVAPAASACPAMTGWTALTDAERTIAEIVACGLSNREVGRRVYLSAHTVDSHLRQIFRKLGINSRVELARIVGEHLQQMYLGAETPVSSPYSHHGPCTKTA